MNILLVCAGGFSTSILVKKMEKWAEENDENITVNSAGKEGYREIWENYDCILTGPQISYAVDDIKAEVSIPVAGMEPMDYALGNAENVVKLAKKITGK